MPCEEETWTGTEEDYVESQGKYHVKMKAETGLTLPHIKESRRSPGNYQKVRQSHEAASLSQSSNEPTLSTPPFQLHASRTVKQ